MLCESNRLYCVYHFLCILSGWRGPCYEKTRKMKPAMTKTDNPNEAASCTVAGVQYNPCTVTIQETAQVRAELMTTIFDNFLVAIHGVLLKIWTIESSLLTLLTLGEKLELILTETVL